MESDHGKKINKAILKFSLPPSPNICAGASTVVNTTSSYFKNFRLRSDLDISACQKVPSKVFDRVLNTLRDPPPPPPPPPLPPTIKKKKKEKTNKTTRNKSVK